MSDESYIDEVRVWAEYYDTVADLAEQQYYAGYKLQTDLDAVARRKAVSTSQAQLSQPPATATHLAIERRRERKEAMRLHRSSIGKEIGKESNR